MLFSSLWRPAVAALLVGFVAGFALTWMRLF